MKFSVCHRQGDGNHTTGFSAVELLIAITIMTLTSAMVLISFTGVRQRTGVNRAAREFALAARRVQNISLSVTEVEAGFASPTAQTVGISIVSGSSSYTIFLDKNENGAFGSGDAVIGKAETFAGGIQVRSIKYIDLGGIQKTIAVAHMISVAPEATMQFTNVSGGSIGDTLEIEIGTPAGDAVRTVTIRTSGQISVK